MMEQLVDQLPFMVVVVVVAPEVLVDLLRQLEEMVDWEKPVL
jgi:hypothetical protein